MGTSASTPPQTAQARGSSGVGTIPAPLGQPRAGKRRPGQGQAPASAWAAAMAARARWRPAASQPGPRLARVYQPSQARDGGQVRLRLAELLQRGGLS